MGEFWLNRSKFSKIPVLRDFKEQSARLDAYLIPFPRSSKAEGVFVVKCIQKSIFEVVPLENSTVFRSSHLKFCIFEVKPLQKRWL